VNIVFVHIGPKVPAHLARNLVRTIKLFRGQPVILITLPDTRCPNIDGLVRIDYSPNDYFWKINENLSHPKDFRGNFWANTLTRFLALHDYMITFQEEFIHVESDVILAEDFPFERFSKLQKPIAFPVVNQHQGIASVLYLRDQNASRELMKVITTEVERNSFTTDMLILRSLYDGHQGGVQALPTGPDAPDSFNGIKNDETVHNIRESLKLVGGIIDGLDIGYFLFGEDPRNHRGKRFLRTILPEYYLNPRFLKFSYSHSRKFINISTSSGEIPIYSLHIHSKDLRLFDLDLCQKVMKRAVKKSTEPIAFDFLPGTFLSSISISLYRKFRMIRGAYIG
jgi:hypothetical protein